MWSGDKFFDGTIDEFMLFDRAITEEEITELFEKEMTLACNIGENTVTFVRDGVEVESFTAVIAQYGIDGVMLNAEKKFIDFTENEEVTAEFTKAENAVKVRCFCFEDFESLSPLK